MVKYFEWNDQKNDTLKRERNISFEIIVHQIETGNLLDIVEHENTQKYGNQKIFVVEYDDYAYAVPFVEDEEKYFLKTIQAEQQQKSI